MKGISWEDMSTGALQHLIFFWKWKINFQEVLFTITRALEYKCVNRERDVQQYLEPNCCEKGYPARSLVHYEYMSHFAFKRQASTVFRGERFTGKEISGKGTSLGKVYLGKTCFGKTYQVRLVTYSCTVVKDLRWTSMYVEIQACTVYRQAFRAFQVRSAHLSMFKLCTCIIYQLPSVHVYAYSCTFE